MGSHDTSDGDSPRLKAGFWASARRVLLLGGPTAVITIIFVALVQAGDHAAGIVFLVCCGVAIALLVVLYQVEPVRRWTRRLFVSPVRWFFAVPLRWTWRIVSWPLRICNGSNIGFTLLRTTGVLAAVLAVLALINSPQIYRAYKQRQAVETINRCDGAVRYDYQLPYLGDEPHGPEWLRFLLGKDFFNDVRRVHLNYVSADDLPAAIAALNALPDLEYVDFSRSDFGDQHVGMLPKLPADCAVDLQHTMITDVGIRELSRTQDIWAIDVSLTAASDEALRSLGAMSNLAVVYAFDTDLTQQGVNQFRARNPGVTLKWVKSYSAEHRQALRELEGGLRHFGLEDEDFDPTVPRYELVAGGFWRDDRLSAALPQIRGVESVVFEAAPEGRWPSALRGLNDVKYVRCSAPLSDQLKSLIVSWKSLESVAFHEVDFLHENLPWLAGIEELKAFTYRGRRLDLDEFLRLPNLGQLKRLELPDLLVFDRHLRIIGKMKDLEELVVPKGAAITDDGLAHLRHLKKLRRLELQSPRITDRGLYYLSLLPELPHLSSYLGYQPSYSPGVSAGLYAWLQEEGELLQGAALPTPGAAPPGGVPPPALAPLPPGATPLPGNVRRQRFRPDWRHELRHAVSRL